MLTFNLRRVKALFVRELYLGFIPAAKMISIVVLVVYVVNMVGRMANPNDHGNGSDDVTPTMIKFGLLLLIGGFAYASFAFKEFGKLSTRAEFLALPGSSLEKISIKWFFTNPLFILLASLLILVSSYLFVPIIHQFGGHAYNNEILFSKEYWNVVGVYFVLHSIFFFGSIAFNRVSIIKTLVALILIGLVVALLNGLWFRIVWADMFDSFFHFQEVHNGTREFGVNYESPDEMWQVRFWQFAFKYLLAPVLWVASLFKFSEKEV